MSMASSAPNSSLANQHPFGEHPSRTLFVRNINSNVEDDELRALFEAYGPIRSMYTQCKHRGFVMISYFDIRHAKNAMRHLQTKVLRRRKLDIHYSIPKDNPSDKDVNQGTLVVFNLDPSITNEELLETFGAFGEIKEIRETPNKKHHKFIEFYDVRDAEKAMKHLNKTEIKVCEPEPPPPLLLLLPVPSLSLITCRVSRSPRKSRSSLPGRVAPERACNSISASPTNRTCCWTTRCSARRRPSPWVCTRSSSSNNNSSSNSNSSRPVARRT